MSASVAHPPAAAAAVEASAGDSSDEEETINTTSTPAVAAAAAETERDQQSVTTCEPTVRGRSLTALIREKRAETVERETAALVAWSNTWLKKRNLQANELASDFSDGVLLINLLEIAFNTTSIGKYNLRPKSPAHKLDNITIAFEWLRKQGVKLVSVDMHDIVARKNKAIIIVLTATMRCLLLRGIGGDIAGSTNSNSVRSNLLKWCNDTFSSQQMSINDFWHSFRDGIVFCHLIDKLCPGKIDLNSLRTSAPLDNLRLAFSIAEQELGIPSLLNAEEFANESGDESLVMNYVCMLISAATATQQHVHKNQATLIQMKNETDALQQQVDEVSAKLTEQLLLNSSTSEQLAKVTENENKWKEAAQKWRESSVAWKMSSDKWKASDEKKSSVISQLMEQHQYDIQQLNAEMYKMHREHEEVLERFKENEIKQITSHRLTEMEFKHQMNNKYKNKSTARAIRDAATDVELINKMPSKSGWLWRRRPNATFHKTRFKKVYFTLQGDCLHYSSSEGGKFKGTFQLAAYKAATPLPNEKRNKEDGTDLIIRLSSMISENSNVIIEFKGTQEDAKNHSDGVDGVTLEWADAINTRIALLQYLKKKEAKKSSGFGCHELIEFITDTQATDLVINSAALPITEPLNILRPALVSHPTIERIHIWDCELDDLGVSVIADILCECPITHLYLGHNKISSSGAQYLAEGIKANKTLQSLNLEYNHIKDEGMTHIAAALQEAKHLTQINLTSNAIGDDGVLALTNALSQSSSSGGASGACHSFPSIELAYNLVGDRGAISIAQLLTSNPSITTLVLHNNLIGDSGVEQIAQSIIKTDHQIQQLYLASNQISSKGVIALSNAFKQVSGEITIDLSANKLVSRSGIAAIVEAKVPVQYELLKFHKLSGNVERDDSDDLSSSARSVVPPTIERRSSFHSISNRAPNERRVSFNRDIHVLLSPEVGVQIVEQNKGNDDNEEENEQEQEQEQEQETIDAAVHDEHDDNDSLVDPLVDESNHIHRLPKDIEPSEGMALKHRIEVEEELEREEPITSPLAQHLHEAAENAEKLIKTAMDTTTSTQADAESEQS